MIFFFIKRNLPTRLPFRLKIQISQCHIKKEKSLCVRDTPWKRMGKWR